VSRIRDLSQTKIGKGIEDGYKVERATVRDLVVLKSDVGCGIKENVGGRFSFNENGAEICKNMRSSCLRRLRLVHSTPFSFLLQLKTPVISVLLRSIASC
jgi:hypothetical protein